MARKKNLPRREDILRQLEKLAMGKANDCVRLALEDEPDLNSLDLTLLTEVKRAKGGAVEVKLADRLKALQQMAALMEGNAPEGENLLLQLLSGQEAE